MAERWPVLLLPSALLVWITVIVCCNWGQLSVAALLPHGPFPNNNATDLQKHVNFFDKNGDGIITITESIQSFIAIGCNPVSAASIATATHAAFGPLTTPPGKLPSTNIHVSHIHRAIHPSDSGAYDKNGTFVDEKFERIFRKHSHIIEDALALWEVEEMLTAKRNIFRPLSWPVAELEWQLIHFLGKDKRGYLHKETVKGIYDGSVFPKLVEGNITLPSAA